MFAVSYAITPTIKAVYVRYSTHIPPLYLMDSSFSALALNRIPNQWMPGNENTVLQLTGEPISLGPPLFIMLINLYS